MAERDQLLSTGYTPPLEGMDTQLPAHSCYDPQTLAKGEYTFNDLKTDTVYTIDPIKTATLTNILNSKTGEKSVSFSIPPTAFHDMRIDPLTSADYKAGLPFLLSCETRHCDFVGGFGGNYPLAEYLSPDGISCTITRGGDYVGHINVWKDAEGNLLLGTLAVRQDEVKSSVLRQTLELFAKGLLETNDDTHSVLLGMGGQNLSVLYPGLFTPGGDGHFPLGRVRHGDNIIEHLPVETTKLESLTQMKVHGQVNIRDQDTLGMNPDNRLDMKNALVFMDAQKAEAVDIQAGALLADLHSKGAYREQKESRTVMWQHIQHRGETSRLEKFAIIENRLRQQGITDVRLEQSKGQDLTISTERKPESLPYRVLDSKVNGDRFVTKLRVGGQGIDLN